MLADQTDQRGLQTVAFEVVGQHAHGVRTEGSDRHQQDAVDGVGLEQAREFVGRRFHLIG